MNKEHMAQFFIFKKFILSDTKCWDFPLDNTNQTDLMHLPPCIPSQSNSSFDSTVLYWNPLKNISCSGSDGIDFIPSSVYTNFSMGVFVIGNGMLYRYNEIN